VTHRFLSTCLLLVAFVLSGAATAQTPKIPVAVNHTGDDSVGQRLAFSVREVVRASRGYDLAQGPGSMFRIGLVTLNPENSRGSQNIWTAAAITFTMRNLNSFDDRNPQTWYPIHLETYIVTVGSGRIEDQAKSIVAALEAAIEEYRKDSKAK
jgi:hypothetical protein